jgi:insecticidal toxin complex protein TccC
MYAGVTYEDKARNLAGQCARHYDVAGLHETDCVALTGPSLSVSRRLLKNADKPDIVADWQEDASAWNDLLDGKADTTDLC